MADEKRQHDAIQSTKISKEDSDYLDSDLSDFSDSVSLLKDEENNTIPFLSSWRPFLSGLAQTFLNGQVYMEVFHSFQAGVVVHEMRYLRLYEGCLESVPQIVIQTYYLAR